MKPSNKSFLVILLLFSANLTFGAWLKRYKEDYHRPTYYNKAHKQDAHVDYNRQEMDERDFQAPKTPSPLPKFVASKHKSYYVHILYKASVFCSGALISRRMVITSSRCFLATDVEPTLEFKAKEMTVIVGNNFGKNERKKVSKVKAFFLPISHMGETQYHSVALLALSIKLDRGTYRYIGLYRQMPAPKKHVNMAFVDSKSHDITLLGTKVVDVKQCKSTFKKINKTDIPFDEDFFCVANKKSGDCSTRPGDPLIIDNMLAGINIYGEQCDELEGQRKLDVYYGIPPTIAFIQRATDQLRAFTGTGPFNDSATTRRTQLLPDSLTTTKLPILKALEKH